VGSWHRPSEAQVTAAPHMAFHTEHRRPQVVRTDADRRRIDSDENTDWLGRWRRLPADDGLLFGRSDERFGPTISV